VETQIRKVLDFAAFPRPGASPGPLRRGIASIRVGTSGSVSATFTILSLHCSRDIVQGLRDSRGDTRGTDFSMDAPGQAMSHDYNGATQLHEERERDRHTAGWAVQKWGTVTLTKSTTSGEGETDHGAT
jgi:hypothetical protein